MQIFNKTKATLALLAAVLVAGFAFAEAGKKITTLWDEGKQFTDWGTIELTGNDVKSGDKLIITYTAAGSAAQDNARTVGPKRTIDGTGQIRLFIDGDNSILFDSGDVLTGEGTVEHTFTAAVAKEQKLIVSARNLTITKVELETDEKPVAQELTNAGFEQGAALDNHLCGYGKDMANNNTTYYGLQDVEGWTKVVVSGDDTNADYPNSGVAGAVFAYGSEWQMKGNSKTAPEAGPDGEAGQALGFFAVWACGGYYCQDVTLAAGKYTFSVYVYNQSGTQANESYTGFFVSDEVKYTVAVNPTVGQWTLQTVDFELTEQTTGQVRLGYKSAGYGSGANPMLFFDNVQLVKISEMAAALNALKQAIETAQAQAATYSIGDGLFYYPASEIAPLNAAIATAQAAYDAAASEEAVKEATATLNAFVASFAPKMTVPAEGTTYTFQLNVEGETPVYMSVTEEGIKIAEEATPLKFVAAETDGQYYLTNEDATLFVGLAGGNAWTMSAVADNKAAWTFTAMPEGTYRINNLVTTGRFVGTNADEKAAGSPCYADKLPSNGNIDWFIAEFVETDYTKYIVNADLTSTETKGFDDAGTKGIDGSGIVKCGNNAQFNFSQTIKNLPAGQYKLTAKAAYRYSGSEQDEYNAIQAGTETKFATLYATVGEKSVTTLVKNRYDGASDTDYTNGNGAVQVNNLWVPNSSAAVQAWFNNGQYVNEVVFNLFEDGDVTIGIEKNAQPEAGDYTVIGPWTLTRLGDAENPMLDVTINHERTVGLSYGATTETVDLEAAKAHLGVDAIEYNMIRIENPDGTLISDYAPFDGWFDGEGVATTWGDNTKLCVKFFQAVDNDGKFEICDMNGADEVDKIYTVKWQLVNGEKAVRYTINVKFVEAEQVAPEVIASIDVPVTMKPATAYEGATATFDAAQVASKLGLAGLADAKAYIVNVTTGEFVLNTTDGWRDANGDAAAWNSSAGMVCVKINNPASGTIDYLGAIDDTYQEGDKFTAKWGFVNGENKAVVLNINITFTDAEPVESEWIQFGEADVCAAGAIKASYASADGSLVLNTTDTKAKMSIDANNAYFGTAEEYVKFTHRLKVGGKSSADNGLSLTIPAEGVLKIYVRSASSGATDRTLVLVQDDVELYNQVVKDADAISVDAGGENPLKVYPIVEVDVKEGTVNVTYPVGSLNFYAFEFVKGGKTAITNVTSKHVNDNVIYNLRGQRVQNPTKGLYIIGGKKVFIK